MLLIWQCCYRNTMIKRACMVNTFGVASCNVCALTNDLSYITEKQNFLERLSLKTEPIFYVHPDLFTFVYMHMQGCQPPTSSNIENWWGVGDIWRWRHNAGHMTSYFGKKRREKDVVVIVTFDLIGLLPTTGVCEETFNVNRRIAQTMQNIWNFIVRESNLQEMANFGNYPGDFRL